MAWAMTRDSGLSCVMSTLALRRKRAPIGGWTAALLLPGLALCDAGYRNWLRITLFWRVKRMAWLMTPWPPWLTGRPSSGRTSPARIERPAASADVQPRVRKLLVFMSQTDSWSACHLPSAFSEGRDDR